jgi:hypothetical protein
MQLRKAILLLVLLSSAAVLGQQTTPKNFLAKVAGVYKEHFMTPSVGGEIIEAENILEVVPINDHAAYVRIELQVNGRPARLWGIATYNKDSLIYDDRTDGPNHCVVEYVWSSKTVTIKVDYQKYPGCRVYHGVGTHMSDVVFSIGRRQEIRYMQRLKASKEFNEATAAYRKRPN